MRHLTLILSVAAGLAGCAGNGAVNIPDGTAPIPPLTPADQSKILGPAADKSGNPLPQKYFQTGNGQLRYISWSGSHGAVNKFIYQAPNGKTYAFDGFTNPPNFSGSFTPDKTQPTKMIPQSDSNGNKLLVCCENFSSSFPAGHLQGVRYGAWIGADGQADLFVGGVLADVNKMQSWNFTHDWSEKGPARGKATYEVWAFRIKDGAVTSSSYNPGSGGIRSLLTVNFNTNKIGGTIKGNADFGPDINFGDVNVNGNTFNGSASSGGSVGQVSGGFYGRNTYGRPDGTEIGGKISFDSRPELNSVFGGAASNSRRDPKTSATDLNPVNP